MGARARGVERIGVSGVANERPVTIVTGASRGIGAAVARRLAADGHDLFLTYRERAAEAERVAAECRELGARVELERIDLADLDRAEGLVGRAVAAMGTVTGLVNNAGITGRIGGFLDAPRDEIEAVFRLNTLSQILVTQAALAHMSTARGGRGGAIVNVSSSAASHGAGGVYIPYAMSKAATNALTLGASREFAAQGVRVNTVSPGTTDTEIHAAGGQPNAVTERAGRIPMGRAGRPEEVAAAVAYLMSAEASYTTGAEIKVTGGS